MNLILRAAATVVAVALAIPATPAMAASSHCHTAAAWRHQGTTSNQRVRVKLWVRPLSEGAFEACAEGFDMRRSSKPVHVQIRTFHTDGDTDSYATGANVRTLRVADGYAYAIAAWATVGDSSVVAAWNRETDR